MIKEVANVYFEALNADRASGAEAGDIVLFLESLKVSTIEQTAESSDARGGWGNPKLVSWDYGKEITLTLQDALFSTESMRFMLGGAIRRSGTDTPVTIRLNAQGALGDNGAVPTLYDYVDGATELTLPESYKFINMTKGVRGQVSADKTWDTVKTDFEKGDIVRFFWEKEVKNKAGAAVEITISPNTFPGTYRIVGDTFIRSEQDGRDVPYQFVIGKGKNLLVA